MKFSKCAAILIFFSIFSFPCAGQELPGRCNIASCNIVAKEVPWPEKDETENNIPIHVGPYLLRLPIEIKSLGISASDHITVLTGQKIKYIVEIINKENIEFFAGAKFNYNGIQANDIPRILFLETPASKEPDSEIDKIFWGWSLNYKKVKLKNVDTPTYMKKDDITVYLLGKSFLGFDNYAAIVSQSYPEFYIKLHGYGTTSNDFLNIISNLAYFDGEL